MPSSPHYLSPDNKGQTLQLTKRIWREYISHYWGRLLIAITCMVIVGAVTAATVKLVEPTIDRLFINKEENLLFLLAGGYFILLSINGFANLIQSVLMQDIGLRSVEKLQKQMFASLQNVELQFLHDNGAANQLSRFTTDVNILRDTISKVFTGFGRDLMKVIFLLATVIMLNSEMALAVFIFIPISVFPVLRIGRRLRKLTGNMQNSMAKMLSILDDSLKGAMQTKSYNMQEYEKSRNAKQFHIIYKLLYKSTRTRSLSYPIMDTLSGAVAAAVISYGGYLIINDDMTTGQFMAIFMAVVAIAQPMKSLANLNSSFQEGLSGAQRIFNLIDYVPKIQDKTDAIIFKPNKGHVEIKDIDFSYDNKAQIFTGLNLEIPAGKTIALVGGSGGGKSTLLNLLPRFYDIDKGAILIDGQNIKDLTQASLRASIGLVSQQTALFNDTIMTNIAYGKIGATDDEIVAAAKLAAAHKFIMDMPDGYESQVGEMGVKLSGGQRQRIAIARAILKNAPLLLLDEATSALDAESERYVQLALDNLMKGRTTLVIAHRLSTVKDADIIYVIDKGKIAEQGKHDDLLKLNGIYNNLYRNQFHDQIDLSSTNKMAE